MNNERAYPGIKGNLDVIAWKEQCDDIKEEWFEVAIHGDPEGLRSFADLLYALADLDQAKLTDLPDDAKEHVHLGPDVQLSGNSAQMTIGRLDPKNGGSFYNGFRPCKTKKYIPAT